MEIKQGKIIKIKQTEQTEEKISFFRVPCVIFNQGEQIENVTAKHRRKWISAISRQDLTDSILDSDRVCSKHFVSGQPAKDWDRFSMDWVPTVNLGHTKQQHFQQVEDPDWCCSS